MLPLVLLNKSLSIDPDRIPLWYSHLLLNTIPDAFPIGLGVCGAKTLPSFDGVPSPDSPKLCLRESEPIDVYVVVNGPLARRYPEPSLYARGELAGLLPRLPGVPLRGVIDRAYRGGVTYFVAGVAGGVALGSNPNRERCVALRSMSKS